MVTVWSALEGQGRPPRDRCARAEWRVVCTGPGSPSPEEGHSIGRLVHPGWYHNFFGWVTDGTQLLSGAGYIHAIQIRYNPV